MANWTPILRDGLPNWSASVRSSAAVAPIITTESLPNGSLGVPYQQIIQVTGSPPPQASITDGQLPFGLNFDEGSREISGTPEVPANETFTVQVENSAGTDTAELTIVVPNTGYAIQAPSVARIEIDADPITMEQGTTLDVLVTVIGRDEQPIQNIAGTVRSSNPAFATVQWIGVTGVSGEGIIRITPVAQGSTEITVEVDAVVSEPIAVGVLGLTVPTITTTALPQATIGVPYSFQLRGTGYPAPTWAVTAGALPPGLTLSTSGLVSGTPTGTTAQAYTPTFRALNSQGNATRQLLIQVSVTMAPPLITTLALPAATVGLPYQFELQATGGAPITWSATNLPTGMTLDGAWITGTPIQMGKTSVAFQASNAAGIDSKNLELSVELPAGLRLVINNVHPEVLATGVNLRGTVFAAPVGSEIVGPEIGEFAGKHFVQDGDRVQLIVPVEEFWGHALRLGDKVKVYLEDDDEHTPIFEVEVTQ